ncbi:hypothetical protein [Bacillus sp. USDA818B3_A]|uniref:hypothetical protein n=1 Tax=Bacillus sp. USDA818B3_A TaxID=2698834 RepID=UPI00136E50C4|nr:hypothetical protein [Bacillus sp. USDA818B3_A]
MNTNEYYRDTANLNLNGSIAALVPATMIIIGNLMFIKHKEIMLLTIPFIMYSLISFQVYLFRLRQSLSITRNMKTLENDSHSLFKANHLLLLFRSAQSSCLFLYFTNGHLAGKMKKFRGTGFDRLKPSRTYVLYDHRDQVLGFYKLKGKKVVTIEVYNSNKKFLGRFAKKNTVLRKTKKELFDQTGGYIGGVEGSPVFMDEQVYDHGYKEVGRLRRGWMPIEWSRFFPEPNTPVLTIKEGLSEEDKLLRMSLLINEYFIER